MPVRFWSLSSVVLVCASSLFGDDHQSEVGRFQGHWQVIELVDDGKVIPREAIREWLPSGGRFEVTDNAIVFTAPHDGKKHAKALSIDPTQYPKTIEISTRTEKGPEKEGWGIYRFDEQRLVICLADPDESERPDAFSAKAGSKRTLMVLSRLPKEKETAPKAERTAPEKPEAEGATAKLLTDAEVAELLRGTWRYADNAGALFISFAADGTFRTIREAPEIRMFKKVFVQTPISSGKWEVRKGELSFHITSSVHASRVGVIFPFTVRSVSEKDLIFVDYLGRLGQAVKVR